MALLLHPALLLVQLRLGAVITSATDRERIVVRVGRREYAARADAFTPGHAEQLRLLYQTGALVFEWPGDFAVLPDCLAGTTRRTRELRSLPSPVALELAYADAVAAVRRWRT